MGIGTEILGWIGLGASRDDEHGAVLESVGAVLDGLTPARARYVAAFAYLLGRVAGADLHVSDEERDLMTRLVAEEGGLSSTEATAVVRLALAEGKRFGGTHNLHVTAEFASQTTHEQRLSLVRCLFALSAADENVTVREENEIRGVTRELRIEHADFIRARETVRAHLAVLRAQSRDPNSSEKPPILSR